VKRMICLILLLTMFAGCGVPEVQTVDLMPNADAKTSALALYIYDGQTITRQHLFEDDRYREQVMEQFHNAQACETSVDVTTLEPPFYGIEMGAGDLGVTYGLWSDGYFITGSGGVYSFDFDFEAFSREHPWDERDTFTNLAVMPCADIVAKTEDGWNDAFLTMAEELTPPVGITMQVQIDGMDVDVTFANDSGAEWGYGYDYGLQVLLDDHWYYVPAEQQVAVIDILCMLPDGKQTQERYSLAPFGQLPAGTYRFVTQQLSSEFTVE